MQALWQAGQAEKQSEGGGSDSCRVRAARFLRPGLGVCRFALASTLGLEKPRIDTRSSVANASANKQKLGS